MARIGAAATSTWLVGIAAVVALTAWWLLGRGATPALDPPELPLASPLTSLGAQRSQPGGSAGAPSTTAAAAVVVDVAGAVVTAGVYQLAAGSRVGDAVRSAGGIRPDADLARVNLAAPVADGARVWIPARGEAAPPELVPVASSGDGRSESGAAPSPIDINAATIAELDELPGVGPATAGSIVEHRRAHGPFASVDELADVRGIGPAKLESIRPLVKVGP